MNTEQLLAEYNKRQAKTISFIRITVNMFLDGKGPIMGYADADMVLREIQASMNKLAKWLNDNDTE
jgi:hypothetical protein